MKPFIIQNRELIKNCKKVAIFDRDGTLNADSGYTHESDKLDILPAVYDAISLLKMLNIEFCIATNQSGVGRGIYSLKEMIDFNTALSKKFEENVGYTFSYLIACIHRPEDQCKCRKPSGLMLCTLIDLLPNLDYCYFGDQSKDRDSALNAGIHGVVVPQGELLIKVKEWIENENL
jgi:histidinol-phosphate phosphatase family protein